jgi:hypothetical protein
MLGIHSVHQLRVVRGSLAQQGEEQLVLVGVVRVEEVQHLPGVRADDLGSRRVIGRGAGQSGELTELGPDDAVDQNYLAGIDAAELVGVILQVPAVAQDDERRAAVAQVFLGAAMFVSEGHLCGRGVDDAGVHDLGHTRARRRVDGVAGVVEPLPNRRRRDQQHRVDVHEGVVEGDRVGEVRAPHRDPVLCEVGEFVNVSAGGHDLGRRRSRGGELINDEPAEVT